LSTDLQLEAGVAAVILDERGRVLLHMRADDGGWSPPSGSVRAGESLSDALAREIAEETGLELVAHSLVGVYSDPDFQIVPTSDGALTHFITCVFRCITAGGPLRGSSEGVAWDWFPPDALPAPLLHYAEVWLADAFAAPAPRVR
jgi:ADP-ribose pyrophosphatase YjhB (NUDIX family)